MCASVPCGDIQENDINNIINNIANNDDNNNRPCIICVIECAESDKEQIHEYYFAQQIYLTAYYRQLSEVAIEIVTSSYAYYVKGR